MTLPNPQVSSTCSNWVGSFTGAADRDRTGTVKRPRDFKSLASACFATPAYPPYRTTGGASLSRAGSAARGGEKSPPAAADNQHAPLASARIF